MPKIAAPTLITGHINADFDCLAAIIAAAKFYPEAILAFPGSQDKTLRQFFLDTATYMFNLKNPKDVDMDSVQRLIVVDTRQRSRVPHVKRVLERADEGEQIEIHLYDHHPDSEEDIEASQETVLPWGSTTTILVRRMEQEQVDLTPEEATLLGLGIYEDTGSLSFNSTVPEDMLAAAYLLKKGMDLTLVSDMLTRDLSAEQVALLSELLDSATSHDINGVDVVIAEASTENYVGDFALLAHKLQEMQNLSVLFALGRFGDRIVLVARSRTPKVDVGAICEAFGGGGHPYAASASIKDMPPSEVKDRLFTLLFSHINPQLRMASLMSAPPVTVDKDRPLAEGAEIMTRYGFKALPVLEPGTKHVAGILEHEIADRGLAHGLGQVEIREYMARDVKTLPPEADLFAAMEVVIDERQHLAPIVEQGELVGVFSKTDLISVLVEEPSRMPEKLLPERRRERSIESVMRHRLDKETIGKLQTAGRVAEEMGASVYIVGGFVRDILLGEENDDIDFVVEGRGIEFARRLAKEFGGRVRTHPKFKTAVIILPGDEHIDVATARLEYYEYPTALPTVELSSIKMDLNRRDFTINALAAHLNPGRFGVLIDFFGGWRDIKERTVRVLHSLSFVEDPTRILRAIRFEQRFGFSIGGQTERLIKSAVKMKFFQKLSGSRIFNELKLIFDEKNPVPCLDRMEQFKLWEQVHPELKMTAKRRGICVETATVLDWYRLLYLDPKPRPWILYMLALAQPMADDALAQVMERLSFTKREARELNELREYVSDAFREIASWAERKGPPSELYFILENVPLEGVLFLMVRSNREDIRRSLSSYLTRHRLTELDIGGDDLKRMGLEPGPAFSRILRTVLAAAVDGEAECRSDQLKLARSLAEGGLPDMRNGRGLGA